MSALVLLVITECHFGVNINVLSMSSAYVWGAYVSFTDILVCIVFFPSVHSLPDHEAVSDDAHRLLQAEEQAAKRKVWQGTNDADPTPGIQAEALQVLGATLQGQDSVFSSRLGKHLQGLV